MFVDSVKINIKAGDGGAGAVSFRREKFVIQGGPDGGDGGNGGDIIFIADKNTSTLAGFRGNKNYFASNGASGEGKNKSGKKGADLQVKVPPGTQIINDSTGEILCDLTLDGQSVRLLKGGKGGLGNARFKNATNQRPTYAQKGISGTQMQVSLELKMIADVALVGFSNAGKSSLISTITNSRPKVANYEFSTLIPNLGVVDISLLESFVVADIPGLIAGASDGKGLGLQFLRHIERTKILLFMLDISREGNSSSRTQSSRELDSRFVDERLSSISLLESSQPTNLAHDTRIATHKIDSIESKSQDSKDSNSIESNLHAQFNVLMNEIKKYSPALADKPYAIAITKSDLDSKNIESFGSFALKDTLKTADTPIFISDELKEFMEFGKRIESKTPLFIIPISSISHTNLNALKSLLNESLKALDSKND
ncbi:GTPase ObgE [Helicobacter saguini]|uniref:GTPase Obg n=1 Tax=Helicobacter saguini TaxID=1548018 RepID=A0A347VSF1_9HELI|nr:GTPase ObgE [Helicobacter saguini]MWV62534.1 GTPase ObgE [Helicobacter saguini]MWV66792.1 GTPase ObgE [Helicobacter saguini]MWV69143.1 GTPase ObgE [Helicobacter saguini]MWV71302.1 GTPase ObgE [Helicobacter saguini]TLD94187.1 GTPase ObgE [Helicobacter saguini]